MTAKDYVTMRFSEYEKAKQEKKENEKFFKSDAHVNMTLIYKTCIYQGHKVTAFYFDIPDRQTANGDSFFNYVILYHTTNFFKKGSCTGTENELLKSLKEIIINDVNNFLING